MNVLAFGAHPDDMDAFCGGTLALYRQQGHEVWMCVVTDGRGRPQGDPDFIVSLRKREAQDSADVIGARLLWLGVPDGGLRADELTRHLFIETIRRVAPDVILTHPPRDYHPDHVVTSQLTIEAAQIARTMNYPSQLAPMRKTVPVAYYDSETGVDFEPEDYVDVSSVWDLKLKMLLAHRSQHMPGPQYDPAFVLPPAEDIPIVRSARVISEFRGLVCNVRYAEAFRWWRAANRIVPRRVLP
jgi:LmbE family N-acetylglucosaminyl deacetylase